MLSFAEQKRLSMRKIAASLPRPTIDGQVGRAWSVDIRRHKPHTTLSLWLLELPDAHPVWWQYSLAVYHLRPTAGIPPAVRLYPEAEYELMIAALDPEKPALPGKLMRWSYLTPFNVIEQFHGIGDAGIPLVANSLVRRILRGGILVECEGIVGARDMWQPAITLALEYARKELSK